MYIDFSQLPAFLGLIVLAVGTSMIGNFIGLFAAAVYNHTAGKDSGHQVLKLLLIAAGSITFMVPIKIGVAFVVTTIAVLSYGYVAAASTTVLLTTGAIGLLYTLFSGSEK
ncbi:MAG: hypothetical protein QG574_2725 [Cyanobacteriota bacterium erpe_2018_sw_21hr_WHONDRS-SW48-000092_B_bin.40]|jgi:hypothetical protein|nr:hypothetical protein [Cyanobacteriota bacterium erpe_2018_sw_21hr_WHONDRS-SW48-000092_B_bin.40]